MTQRTDRSAAGSPQVVIADLDVFVKVGARTATALVRSSGAHPLQLTVDNPALLLAEVSRRPVIALLGRLTADTAVEVRRSDGTRLVRRFRDKGRWRIEWTRHGIAAIPRAVWIRATG